MALSPDLARRNVAAGLDGAQTLEGRTDRALAIGVAAHQNVIAIEAANMGSTNSQVNAMAQRYRDVGWDVRFQRGDWSFPDRFEFSDPLNE